MKSQRWFGAVCIVLVSVAVRGAEEPRRVGRLGEPARWTIEGAKTFTADEIRAALFGNFEIAAACGKDAPVEALTAAMAAKTIGGYQQAGFPDVKVSVVAGGDHFKLTIEEGDRYAQGESRVHASRALDGDRIRDALTRPGVDKKRPLWSGEEPASFNAEFNDWLTAKVAELAEEQGFYRASFNASVMPDSKAKKGTLDIEFVDEGPRTTLGDVEIAAGAINPPEKVLAYLALDAQTPLTREVREEAVRQLLRSGRFLRAQWKLGETNKRNNDWRPQLALTEYDQAPALDAPLTREEAALLKLAEWVERFDESDEEILLQAPGEKISMILAPRHGYILEYLPPVVAGGAEANEGIQGAIVMAEERVGLYSASQRRKIDAAPPPAPLRGNAEITLITGGSSMDSRGRLTFGAGLWRSASSPRRHIDIKLRLSAAAALSVVRTHNAKVTWEGDVVCFDWKYRQMRINASTGQLLEQIVHTAVDEEGKADPDNSFVPHIKVGAGQFARRLAEIEKLTADWPNAADGQRPLSCVSEFLCQELQLFDPEAKGGYAAIGKLVNHGLLRPFDELTARLGKPQEDHFIAPQRYFRFHFNSLPELLGLAGTLSRAWGLGVGNWLFPNDSWTQAAWRDGVFLLAGESGKATADLWRQLADGRGPLCALAAAEMLHAAGSNHFAEHCASRGLQRLSLADLHNDCRDLLDGRGFVSQCLLQAVAATRQLDPADIQAIADLLKHFELIDDSQAAILAFCAGALRGDEGASPSQTAAKALDVLWTAGLSALVEKRLKALASPPALPEPPAYASLKNGAVTAGPAAAQTASPAPEAAGYGGAPYGATLDRNGRPLAADAQASPTEPETSVETEVRELKSLAQAVTDRLTRLEKRLTTGDQAAADVAPPPGEAPIPAQLGESGLLFHLHGPAGLEFVPDSPNPASALPIVLQLGRARVSAFSLTGLKGHDTERLDVVIRTAVSLPERLLQLPEDLVPVQFKETDLNAALKGVTVTTVVLYVEDAEGGQKIETLTSAEERSEAVSKASRQGAVLAVVSLTNEAWRYSPEAPSAAKNERRSDAVALDGFCAVALVDRRIWQKGDAKFVAVLGGRTYQFASEAALKAFVANADRYTPALDGNDPVLAVDQGLTVPGRREHGAFYNGRIYLFSTEQTFQQFDAAPERYLGSPVVSVGAAPPLGTESGDRATTTRR